MIAKLILAGAIPVVGLTVAALLPRRNPAEPKPSEQTAFERPLVVQRSADTAVVLLDASATHPAQGHPTTTVGVFTTDDIRSVTWRPALVTVGRLGADDVLVDLEAVGIVALTGDRSATLATLRSVWSELRWPNEAHELEVVGIEGLDGFPGLEIVPWSHALTRMERGPERSRPLIVLADQMPSGDDALRLDAARPGQNVGVLLAAEWDSVWRIEHSESRSHLLPLGLDLALMTGDAVSASTRPVTPKQSPVDHVSVSVLGPATVTGRLMSAKETELVVFLAMSPNGATEAQIRTALWPDRDVPRGTFNNLVSAARRNLGTASDGELRLPHVRRGRYRLHADVRCDLDALAQALESGDDARLLECLAGVHGRPFDGWTAGDWPFDDAIVSRAEVLIGSAAERIIHAGCDDAAILTVANALRCLPDDSVEAVLSQLRAATN